MLLIDYDPLKFKLPSMTMARYLLAPQKAWFSPQFFGLENIQTNKPALYIGNHTLFGALDAPLMVAGLYEKTGVYLRAVADRAHFYVPAWRNFLVRYGSFMGTRENCAALMRSGQNILLYPGGAREVAKNKGENYQLIWKNRTGFAALAIEHGYDIIPFGALGADDSYSIHYDANDFRASVVGRALTKTGVMSRYLRNGDAFNPVATGIGKTLIPRPEKQYFSFGAPISTTLWQGHHQEKEAQYELRAVVAQQVYAELDKLFAIRAQDDDWKRWRKFLTRR